jgi:NAD(P)-dependent dehydrogenase (short-subunit alcohol dehydrogenase family)
MSADTFHLANGKPKTVIVTGGAGGIGAQTIREFHSKGCNVAIADLPHAESAGNDLISSLSAPERAMFHPTDITNWENMRSLFKKTKEKFGQIDIVVANAGIMESQDFFDFEEDEGGELKESVYPSRVIDINLKGTMNSAPHSVLSLLLKNPN